MRVAIYSRVSTDKQTVENQVRELKEVAERRGWRVVAEFADQGISGAKGRDKRPGLDQMLKDAARARFDVVMVWALDRLGRSMRTNIDTIESLHAANRQLYIHQEGFDTTTPMGMAFFQISSAFAQLERRLISERVKAGLARTKANGTKLGPKQLEETNPTKYQYVRTLFKEGKTPWRVHTLARIGNSTAIRIQRQMQAKGEI